jgi:hypothetical protein
MISELVFLVSLLRSKTNGYEYIEKALTLALKPTKYSPSYNLSVCFFVLSYGPIVSITLSCSS